MADKPTWITPTDEDVLPADAGERQSIGAAKGVDDLPDIVEEVVETFRTAIRNGGQQLGPAGTVPLGVKQYVLDRALWIFITRGVTGNEELRTKSRQDNNSAAEKILQSIMSGDFRVIPVDAKQSITNAVEVASSQRRKASGRKMEGLI